MKKARVSSPDQQKNKLGPTSADPMAGTSSGLSELECPVCHEEFTTPKLLPCAHTVCRHCIQTWLDRKGGLAECPLCRSPLGDPAHHTEGQLGYRLPTDLMMKDLVTIQKTLEEPHTCHMCPATIATAYCFQCGVKLCANCSKYHRKLPGTASHALEEMKKLTVQQLLDNHRTACPKHPGSVADMYCSSHEELICMTCFQTRHRDCPRPKTISDAAKEKRGTLNYEADWLATRTVDIAMEIDAAKTHFQDMRKKATEYFDDLEMAVRNRRQAVNNMIQEEEETIMTSAAELERLSALMSSHVRVVERAAASADDTLLQMQQVIITRMGDLDAQGERQHLRPLQELRFDRPASLALPCLGKLVNPAEKLSLPSTSKRKAEPVDSNSPWKRIRMPHWGYDDDDSSSCESQC